MIIDLVHSVETHMNCAHFLHTVRESSYVWRMLAVDFIYTTNSHLIGITYMYTGDTKMEGIGE